jgi:hypothetical protein
VPVTSLFGAIGVLLYGILGGRCALGGLTTVGCVVGVVRSS